ncbi:unnamed protein product [Fraxinus pennsylvanica]|uniref:PPM-type phosphatase domain-containing protein n=1 Tax=Fraxinus pennsylvanica TaxID=56036 RepID=A0AAD1ZWT6_9LAMI|nr:unnamed protein product [Fraxinus pennsylvanica]
METRSEVKASKFKRICVFCGSSQGKKTSYQEAVIDLGNELGSQKGLNGEYGVISIPEFSHRILSDRDKFIVLASDGAFNLIKPIASVKLSITLSLSSDLLEYVIGDEKQLMQVLLNAVGML